MTRILHLFNIFGAATEKAMLDYTLALAADGWALTAGYETLADEAPPTPLRRVKLDRIQVEPEPDIAAQLERVAAAPRCSAHQALLDEPFDLVHGHFGPRVLQGAGLASARRADGGEHLRLRRHASAARPLLDRTLSLGCGPRCDVRHAVRSMACRLLALGLPESRVRLIRLGVALDEHAYAPQPRRASRGSSSLAGSSRKRARNLSFGPWSCSSACIRAPRASR